MPERAAEPSGGAVKLTDSSSISIEDSISVSVVCEVEKKSLPKKVFNGTARSNTAIRTVKVFVVV
jgi:hypothetical protein